MWGRILALMATWAVALVLLYWGHLPFRWRRLFALLTSALGIVFLVLALNSEGQRESATVGSFLMGAPYVAGKVSAAASLPYYVVTGVLLTLGFVGLAAGDGLALLLARRYFLNAVLVSWMITALRVLLEKVAAPEAWARLVGVTWLAPVVGAYFALNLKREGRSFRDLLLRLVGYAFAVRGLVALVMVAASALRLGTHYDMSRLAEVGLLGRTYHFEPGSLGPILTITAVAQLVFWPIYTVLSGLVGAGIARLLLWAWPGDRLRPARTPPPLPAAGES